MLKVLDCASKEGFGRSLTKIAREAGVVRQTISGWLQEVPEFQTAWDNIPHKALRAGIPGVIMALYKRALSGDIPAIREFLAVAKYHIPVIEAHLTGNVKIDLNLLDDDELTRYESLITMLADRGRARAAADSRSPAAAGNDEHGNGLRPELN